MFSRSIHSISRNTITRHGPLCPCCLGIKDIFKTKFIYDSLSTKQKKLGQTGVLTKRSIMTSTYPSTPVTGTTAISTASIATRLHSIRSMMDMGKVMAGNMVKLRKDGVVGSSTGGDYGVKGLIALLLGYVLVEEMAGYYTGDKVITFTWKKKDSAT